jgi:crotonobetainyl-CoA:carnitine CoA-transferase CaiB-like acyl-CoA transferase
MPGAQALARTRCFRDNGLSAKMALMAQLDPMADSAFDEILAVAGVPKPAPDTVAITGADPVMPTPFRIGAAGAAALAATGIVASELWRLRTGRAQRIAVDVRAAAESLRGLNYLRIDGAAPTTWWDPFSGYYPVRDGWISIHCNFPNHRDAALAVLGSAEDRAAAEAASRSWDGVALEDAIHAAGGCASFARTSEEWSCHPQCTAVAGQPLIAIRKFGEAPPQPLPAGDRPLAGVRVLDLTRVLAGPTATKTLAEHGADVLKITAGHLPDQSAVDLDTGIGKLSARLDLRTHEGVERLRALVRDGDVFVQSYRPGALAARGFAPDDLAGLRPGIVAVDLSAWGDTGPWRHRRGFDSIVQTVSGMAYASGSEKPKLMPVSAIDYISGYLMALGAMVALARRAQEGGSWLVSVSLARVGKWIVDRGLVDAASLASVPQNPSAEVIAALSTEMSSVAGRIGHLKPVVRMSETPPHWARPPVPLGSHAPEWPER